MDVEWDWFWKLLAEGQPFEIDSTLAPALLQLRNKEGQSPLHLTDDPQTLQQLLTFGLDPNAQDLQGRTPLMRYRRVAGNRLLLEAGALVNAKDHRGNMALDYQAGALECRFGYHVPEFGPLDHLLAAGAEPPTGERAQRWIKNARSQVTDALELRDNLEFERWVKQAGGGGKD